MIAVNPPLGFAYAENSARVNIYGLVSISLLIYLLTMIEMGCEM